MENKHTAVNLWSKIRDMGSSWGVMEKIGSITTDNAANIKLATRAYNMPCIAHTLNLIVGKGVSLPPIQCVISQAKKIVEYVKRYPFAARNLAETQSRMGLPCLKVKQDVITRWNSTYLMLARLMEIRQPLDEAMKEFPDRPELRLEESVWVAISGLIRVLKLFHDATLLMSVENKVAISQVILMISSLRLELEKISEEEEGMSEEVQMLIRALNEEIQERFHLVEDSPEYAESHLLDPRTKNLKFWHDSKKIQAIEGIKEYLKQWEETSSSASEEAPLGYSENNWLWRNSVVEATLPIVHRDEWDDFSQEIQIGNDKDPLLWWEEKKTKFPHLYELAKKRFSVCASSVSSERLFSKAGQAVTDRRNRLKGDKVSMILFLCYNL